MKKLLSIIVPTKNRYGTLKYIVETVSKMQSKELELIIQDNSDDNSEFLKIMDTYKDENIKYFYSNERLSVVDNSNLAVKHSNGEYVCFIGDDDTFVESLMNFVRYMKNNAIESAICNMGVYFWPGIVFKFHNFSNLKIPKCNGNIKNINVNKELHNCLKYGASKLGNMPKLYHGVVKKSVLDEIYKIAGSYFPGPSPDMANAVALSLIVKSHVYIDVPLIISGQSYKSAGGMGARHAHKADLKNLDFLPNDTEKNWEEKIPKIWTGATIYAESAIKSLKNMGQNTLMEKFNYYFHYAYFICFNREYKKMINQFIKKEFWGKILVFFYFINIFIKRCIIFGKNLLITKFLKHSKYVFDNIENTEIASRITNDFIINNNIDIKYKNN